MLSQNRSVNPPSTKIDALSPHSLTPAGSSKRGNTRSEWRWCDREGWRSFLLLSYTRFARWWAWWEGETESIQPGFVHELGLRTIRQTGAFTPTMAGLLVWDTATQARRWGRRGCRHRPVPKTVDAVTSLRPMTCDLPSTWYNDSAGIA